MGAEGNENTPGVGERGGVGGRGPGSPLGGPYQARSAAQEEKVGCEGPPPHWDRGGSVGKTKTEKRLGIRKRRVVMEGLPGARPKYRSGEETPGRPESQPSVIWI